VAENAGDGQRIERGRGRRRRGLAASGRPLPACPQLPHPHPSRATWFPPLPCLLAPPAMTGGAARFNAGQRHARTPWHAPPATLYSTALRVTTIRARRCPPPFRSAPRVRTLAKATLPVLAVPTCPEEAAQPHRRARLGASGGGGRRCARALRGGAAPCCCASAFDGAE